MKKLLVLLSIVMLVGCSDSMYFQESALNKGKDICTENGGVKYLYFTERVDNDDLADFAVVTCNNGVEFTYKLNWEDSNGKN